MCDDYYDDYERYDYEPDLTPDDGNGGYSDIDYYGDYETNHGYSEEADDYNEEHQDHDAPVSTAINPASLLCTVHDRALNKDCDRCKALKVILSSQQLTELGIEVADSIPDAVTWLTGGPPVADKRVTLVLPKVSEEYGHAVYFAPPQAKGVFEAWVRDFLFLAFPPNQVLMKNLDIEKMILQFEGALSPHYMTMLKEVRNVMLKNLKNTRHTHRPLLLAIAKLDELIRALRLAGCKAGLEFPDAAPEKTPFGPKACIIFRFVQYVGVLEVLEI